MNTDVVISTLGPKGTCSESASQFFLEKKYRVGQVCLFKSFEEALESLRNEDANISIIPSAYSNLHNLIFDNVTNIYIDEVFIYDTPKLVLATKKGNNLLNKVASHSSPKNMLHKHLPNIEILPAMSNSHAAEMLNAGDVDACLTTIICARMMSLDILYDFGNISMSWNVFKKRKSEYF